MANLVEDFFINKLSKNIDSLTEELNSVSSEFDYYITQIGGAKKFTNAGTYSFKIPKGISTIKVSGIGGGGGGGGGGTHSNAAGGGGGGGRAYYTLDFVINVTEGEILTVIIGAGGAGGQRQTVTGNGYDGKTGEKTQLLRGETVLFTVNAGTYGSGGLGSNGGGGAGGSVGGVTGTARSSGGAGGAGGSTTLFAGFGNGGAGGAGSSTSGINDPGKAGSAGKNGALVICFGANVSFQDVGW